MQALQLRQRDEVAPWKARRVQNPLREGNMRFEKILVPVDFSDCSKAALHYAQELARRLGASVDVLHVWYTPAYISPSVAVMMADGKTEALEVIARTQAQHQLDEFRRSVEQVEGVLVNNRIEYGYEPDVILKMATEYDLVIMGTHGRTGMAHLFMGSVAEKVIRRAPCPVIAIRAQPAASGPEASP